MSDSHVDPLAKSYDEIPYIAYPYPFTHPRQLEAQAALFGLLAPPIDRCRVLELGCAAGGNLIPQAIDLPDSEFLGIDLSERQIRDGQKLINELGVRNIELRQANLMEIDASWGQFDYIVSHGVFSWMPAEARAKLMEVNARNLAPNGVAFVSYNTYPGWHMAGVVRDIMRYHTQQFSSPAKKIEQAKAVLDFLTELVDERAPIAAALKAEADGLKVHKNDSYLYHEHLEADNHPLYFHEFMAQAEACGLQYLAESDFSTMLLRNLPEAAQATLRRLSLIQQEQYMDFIRGRRFRKTLLCHNHVRLDRSIRPARMEQFHVALTTPFHPVAIDLRNDEMTKFQIGSSSIETSNRLMKATFALLRDRYPSHIGFRPLLVGCLGRLAAIGRPMGGDEPPAELLGSTLLSAYGAGMIDIAVHPPAAAYMVTERPTVSRLARHQAMHSNHFTNQRHSPVQLDPVCRRVVYRLDGRHDRLALTRDLLQAVASGDVRLADRKDAPAAASPDEIDSLVGRVLHDIRNAGLLVE